MSGKLGLFKCPSCKALVRSEKALEEGITCSECGFEFGRASAADLGAKVASASATVPGGRVVAKAASSGIVRDITAKKSPPLSVAPVSSQATIPSKPLEQPAAAQPSSGGDEEIVMPDGTIRVRRRKKRPKKEKHKNLILFLVGWLCLIAVVLAIFKFGLDKKDEENADQVSTDGPSAVEQEILRQSLPTIDQNFKRFLSYAKFDGREQFIDRSSELSLEFSRFYRDQPFPTVEGGVRRIDANVLNFSDEAVAIETIWEDENGNKAGAVHVFDRKEGWKLDWEHFAPYSTEDWSRFTARLGDDEGTFRVFLRKRLTDDQSETFSLSFYRARQPFEDSNRFQNSESPEVVVKSDTALGQEILRRWNDNKEGKSPPYGAIIAKETDPDPEGYVRVIAKLAWEEDGRNNDVLVLKDLIGLDWYGERIQDYHERAINKATEQAVDALSE